MCQVSLRRNVPCNASCDMSSACSAASSTSAASDLQLHSVAYHHDFFGGIAYVLGARGTFVSTFAMAPVLLAGSKTNSTVLLSNMLAPNDDVSFCAQAMTCERLASMRPQQAWWTWLSWERGRSSADSNHCSDTEASSSFSKAQCFLGQDTSQAGHCLGLTRRSSASKLLYGGCRPFRMHENGNSM